MIAGPAETGSAQYLEAPHPLVQRFAGYAQIFRRPGFIPPALFQCVQDGVPGEGGGVVGLW